MPALAGSRGSAMRASPPPPYRRGVRGRVVSDVLGPIALVVSLAVIAVAIVIGMRRRVIVYPWETVLVYRDGVFQRELAPGVHHVTGRQDRYKVVRLATYPQHATFGALDVVSADRFAFRLHVALTYTLADPRAAWEAQEVAEVGGYAGPTFHERVATAVLAAVGARSLDEVIGDARGTGEAARGELVALMSAFAVEALGVTRFELPPETRRMLTEVERARREGQAALERARGEQASLRALANAARLVKDNPELAQLRLLKTIEDAKGPTTIVLGDPRGAAA